MIDDHAAAGALCDNGGVRQPPKRGTVHGNEQVRGLVILGGGNHHVRTGHKPVDARNRRSIRKQENDLFRRKVLAKGETETKGGAQRIAIGIGVSRNSDGLGALDAIYNAPPHVGGSAPRETTRSATHATPGHRRLRYPHRVGPSQAWREARERAGILPRPSRRR